MPGLVAVRKHLRPCEVSVGMPGSLGKMDEHQGIAPCILRWKRSVYLSTLMLEEMACRAVARGAIVKVRLRTSCFGETAFTRDVRRGRRLESRAGMDFPSLARWVPQAGLFAVANCNAPVPPLRNRHLN